MYPSNINPSNIMWRDATGVIRKWIDQKTGAVMEHECDEVVSQCCGAGRHEYVDTACIQCQEHTDFECIDCGVEVA